jgi:hypothetical protein
MDGVGRLQPLIEQFFERARRIKDIFAALVVL